MRAPVTKEHAQVWRARFRLSGPSHRDGGNGATLGSKGGGFDVLDADTMVVRRLLFGPAVSPTLTQS